MSLFPKTAKKDHKKRKGILLCATGLAYSAAVSDALISRMSGPSETHNVYLP